MIVINTSSNVDPVTRINTHEPWKDVPSSEEIKQREPSKNKMRTAPSNKEKS